MHRHRRLLAAVLLGLSLTAAACGPVTSTPDPAPAMVSRSAT